VTLPKGARALTGAESEGYVCGTMHVLQREPAGEQFKVVVLMLEAELQSREQAIRENPEFTPQQQAALIADLNGNVQRMSLDAQRRVVLPSHFVGWLALERELYMFSTNTTVLVWHPHDWLRWSGHDEEQGPDVRPLPFLVL